MKFNIALGLLLSLTSCGQQERVDKRSNPNTNQELEKLKNDVLKLQGTIAQINSFVASNFTNCDNSLPPFETKICQIAQTATAEQQIVFVGQLQQISKIFQTELYGLDCINTTDPGCPVVGSITEQVAGFDARIDDIENDLADVQLDVAQLTVDLATLTTRLNNFNGSGSSIEVVVTGIESDITSLESRVDDLEQTINNGDIYRTFLICKNIANVGPAYEPVLITGSDQVVVAYIVSGTSNGMGVVSSAGVTGNYFSSTTASTRACNFKIYDRTTTVKLCWKNTDRQATSAAIDTACNAPSFVAPLVTCTCAN